MHIIVVGCGRMGAELAYRFFLKGDQVTVLDQKSEAFKHLHVDFRGRTIEGDGLSQSALQRANIEKAAAIAVVTNNDVVNAVIGHIARVEFKVPQIVVRSFDSRWQSIHEAFSHTIVSSTMWAVARIEQLVSRSDIRVVFSSEKGNIHICEVVIPIQFQNRRLGDVFSRRNCRVVSVTRGGETQEELSDEYELNAGDVVLISTISESGNSAGVDIDKLRKNLNLSEE